jgi:hypothetical protein
MLITFEVIDSGLVALVILKLYAVFQFVALAI